MLQCMVQEFEETFIIIDAIDECESIEILLDFVHEVMEWKLGKLHLLITSRPQWEIESSFLSTAAISVSISSASVDADIRVYVRERLLGDKSMKRWNSTIQEEIETTIMEGAEGM